MVADGEEEAFPGNRGDQLLREKEEESPADGREVKVVHLEEKVELERLTVAHKLPASEDNDVVCDECDHTDFERRKRRLSLYEAKVLRLVAHNRLKHLLEDGP